MGTFHSKKCSKMFSTCFLSKKSNKFTRTTYISRANGKIKQMSFMTELRKLFFAFCETTKIGGVSYLGRHNTSYFGRYCLNFMAIIEILKSPNVNFGRFFWICVLLAMVVFAGILINLLSLVYASNATLISSNKPIFASQIGFPAITLCPKDQIISSKIAKFVEMS